MERVIFVFQTYFICDQSNKFRVGRLTFSGAYRIAEKRIDRVHFAPAPCNFDCMTYGTFYPARGRLMFFCDRRIQDFRDRIQHLHIVDCKDDRIPQILVSLDMRRNSDLVDNIGDISLQITFAIRCRLFPYCLAYRLTKSLYTAYADMLDAVQ